MQIDQESGPKNLICKANYTSEAGTTKHFNVLSGFYK